MKLKKLIYSEIITSFTKEISLNKIMKYAICFAFIFFSISSLYSCTANNKHNVDTVSLQNRNTLTDIKRLDVDVFDYLEEPTSDKANSLKNKYGDLFEAFGIVTINNSDVEEALFFEVLRNYFNNEVLKQIYKDELTTFKDLIPYQTQLDQVNILLNEYLPNKQLPQLAIHVSGFKENIIVLDSIISISGDKYLGNTYPIYKDFFEDYQIVQMQPKMITRDYIKAWLLSETPKTNQRKNLLSEMISEGKILYILKQLLPDWSDNDLIGYTSNQLQWATENEKQIWQKTIQNKYLYSNDSQIINKYISESPFTVTISADSPGSLGKWIGWQIVNEYMNNTNSSIEELFENNDNQKILKLSKYNP